MMLEVYHRKGMFSFRESLSAGYDEPHATAGRHFCAESGHAGGMHKGFRIDNPALTGGLCYTCRRLSFVTPGSFISLWIVKRLGETPARS